MTNYKHRPSTPIFQIWMLIHIKKNYFLNSKTCIIAGFTIRFMEARETVMTLTATQRSQGTHSRLSSASYNYYPSVEKLDTATGRWVAGRSKEPKIGLYNLNPGQEYKFRASAVNNEVERAFGGRTNHYCHKSIWQTLIRTHRLGQRPCWFKMPPGYITEKRKKKKAYQNRQHLERLVHSKLKEKSKTWTKVLNTNLEVELLILLDLENQVRCCRLRTIYFKMWCSTFLWCEVWLWSF